MKAVARVLGTRVYPLDVRSEAEVCIVSDLHLHPSEAAVIEAFDRLLASAPELVLILGDLFDYWVGRSQLAAREWSEAIDCLSRATRRGQRLYVLHGNRDFQLDAAFEKATGARVVAGGLWLQRERRDLLCLHGDELCQNDLGYQRAKRVLRNPALRFVMHRLPFSWSKRLAGKARRVSQETVQRARNENLEPSRRALGEVAALGDIDLLFGHVHRAGCGDLTVRPGTKRFFVLPAFEDPDFGFARLTKDAELALIRNGDKSDWPEYGDLSP